MSRITLIPESTIRTSRKIRSATMEEEEEVEDSVRDDPIPKESCPVAGTVEFRVTPSPANNDDNDDDDIDGNVLNARRRSHRDAERRG